MSEIEVFRDESSTDSSDPPAAVQSTSVPQGNSLEPAAAIRGRRPSRTTAANAAKRRSPPSPSPPRQRPPSPASSYASVFSHAPSAENWTVAGLRQVLTSAGVTIPRRSSKPDLLALYNSLQSGELPNSSPPLKSATTASKSRKSPYSRPGPIFTPSRTGLRPPNCAPDAAALSPTFLELSPSASSQLSPAKSQPSRPQAASPEQARLRQRQTAIHSLGSTNPSPTHGPQLRHLRLALLHQCKPRLPLFPPLSPFTKPFQAQTYPNHWPKHPPFPLSSTQSAPSPEPFFSFYRLAFTHPSKRTRTGTTPRSQLHQVTNSIRNSEHWHRRRIHSPPQYLPFQNWYSLKPPLETSPRSFPQLNSPSSLPKNPPVIPDSMEKL